MFAVCCGEETREGQAPTKVIETTTPMPMASRDQSHLDILRTKWASTTGPAYALHVKNLNLPQREEDEVAYTAYKLFSVEDEGKKFSTYGRYLYFIQVVAAALVPVLIGILGSFNFEGSESFDTVVRIIAIVLSIGGTVAKATEDVYDFQRRGQATETNFSEMAELFHQFIALSGPKFDPTYKADDASKDLVIPDLRSIPLHILDAEVAAIRKEAKEKENDSNDIVNRHTPLVPVYINAFNTYMKEIRLATSAPGQVGLKK